MLKIDNTEITLGNFPDGTLAVKAPSTTRGEVVYFTWLYENDAELFALACLRDKYKNHEAHLYMPYIPHARMDRTKNPEDVFTLKTFCNMLNAMDFAKVWVLDAHSNVSLALLNNVCACNVNEHIITALSFHDTGNTALFFPDEGSMKRYADSFTNIPFGFGMKKRDWVTGNILGLNIMQEENIVGKDVLIIDDICSAGGTFYYSAKALKDAGAKSVSLYITHCENTILKGKIFTSGLIDKIYTTNSLIHCAELKDKLIYV